LSSSSASRYGEKRQRGAKQLANCQDTSFNLDKARHEVRQLGIKGLSNESKEDAILNKLIQLGAKVHYFYLHLLKMNRNVSLENYALLATASV